MHRTIRTLGTLAATTPLLSPAACPAPPARPAEAPRPATTVELGAGDIVEGAGGFRESYVTVMPNDLALVRERRAVTLPAGVSSVAYMDVLDTVVPESTRVRFHPEGGDSANVQFLEQRYRYDLIEPARIQELSRGGTVRVRWTHGRTGSERAIDGVLESTEQGLFVRTPDGTYTLAQPGTDAWYERVTLDELPEALFSRPLLDWIIDVAEGGKGVLETSYLARGLSWEADYVITASEDFGRADLLGWVTLRNQTAGRFEDAHLSVVAGEIHMAPPAPDEYMYYGAEGEAEGEAEYDYGYVEEGLFEYHLYKLNEPATLEPYSWKQVAFLNREAVPITTEYEANIALQPWNYGTPVGTQDWIPTSARRLLRIENKADVDGLGIPLPAGTARVYARTGEDLFFISSDQVEDTPREEPIEIDAGGAPFLVVKYKIADVDTAHAGRFGCYTVVRHAIQAVNRGSRPATVLFVLRLPGAGRGYYYPYGGGEWDARLERAEGVIGPVIVETGTGVWEMERVLEPDVMVDDELVLRMRSPC